MATYILVNVAFIAIVLLMFRVKLRMPPRQWWIVLSILIVLTAIFDSLIIFADIVAYDTSKILGLYVGYAPIEDFFYALFSALIIPLLWNRLGGRHAAK
jgi:lycopene cyclase domain-containing protein